jgi:hypothetical protein
MITLQGGNSRIQREGAKEKDKAFKGTKEKMDHKAEK